MTDRDFILQYYGKEHELLKTIEECDELKIEILKVLNKRGNKENVKEEIADVMNMCLMSCKALKINIDEVKKIANNKIKRTLARIEEEQKKLQNRSKTNKNKEV